MVPNVPLTQHSQTLITQRAVNRILLSHSHCAIQAEKQLSEMVVGKALEAKIDRPAGVVRWGQQRVLGTFDSILGYQSFHKLSCGEGVAGDAFSLL